MKKTPRNKFFLSVGLGLGAGLLSAYFFSGFEVWQTVELGESSVTPESVQPAEPTSLPVPPEPVFKVTHQPTPEAVKAIYMTSWVAGTPSFRDHLIGLVETTELNALVVDIKDYSGKIAFAVESPELLKWEASENRIPNPKEFIGRLHDKGIYVIGRISVFQDPYLVEKRPNLAVRRESDGGIWRDRKGLAWLDPTVPEVWDYIIALARESYEIGFDELNFDYIRFPSDGNMQDIAYSHFDEATETRAEAIEKFFAYLAAGLEDLAVPISADLFGLVTVNHDDLGIGQVLERALPHFDYIAPMVYPSHYANGFIGYTNPAAAPYEVVKYSLDEASRRIELATSTPSKLRPWLQDFDLGADYTAEMVRAQIQATYDAGLNSWMLWDPSNKYTREALLDSVN